MLTENDNGYASRKFWLVQEFLLLMLLGYVATIHWEAARPEFGTWGGMMLAGLGLYFGVNFANKKWAPDAPAPSDQDTKTK
jgi:hypothetical protein